MRRGRTGQHQPRSESKSIAGRGAGTLPGACAPQTPFRRTSLAVAAAVGLPAALCLPHKAAAQEQPRITVSPSIVARAASESALPIGVGPTNVVPARSFVSLRGMPPEVTLTEGHPVAPGAWAIPLSALPTLKARIPPGVSGRTEIVIRLIGMDGRLLAQATTVYIVEPGAGRPVPQPPAPAAAPPAQTALGAVQKAAPEPGKQTT